MSMADDVAAFKSLGRCVVGHLRIGEGASCQVRDLYGDVEGLFLGNVLTRAWGRDDRGDHVCFGGNVAHNCRGEGQSVVYQQRKDEDGSPMPLQEPVLTWAPLVRVLPVQKLIKLVLSL